MCWVSNTPDRYLFCKVTYIIGQLGPDYGGDLSHSFLQQKKTHIFVLRSGFFYCKTHFAQLIAPKCEGCHHPFRYPQHFIFLPINYFFGKWSDVERSCPLACWFCQSVFVCLLVCVQVSLLEYVFMFVFMHELHTIPEYPWFWSMFGEIGRQIPKLTISSLLWHFVWSICA